MTQTGEKASLNCVAIKTDSGIEQIPNVADIAEVSSGRLMVATLDGEQNIVGGTIFGAIGIWKMWHERANSVEQFVADTPLTIPPLDTTHFRYQIGDLWVREGRGGRIKRLKRIDL